MSRRTGGGRLSVPYDTLLYAPGSTIDVTSVPGVAEHAHTVAGPESALAIAAALRADPRARVVVVGGGLTGLELAAEVAESFPHADVTLVTAGRPGGWLSARAQAYVADALDALGVRRITDTRVTRVAAGTLDNGRAFDLCLWAGGFTVPPPSPGPGVTRWRWAAARVASRDRGRPTSSSRGCAACPLARSGSATSTNVLRPRRSVAPLVRA